MLMRSEAQVIFLTSRFTKVSNMLLDSADGCIGVVSVKSKLDSAQLVDALSNIAKA